MTFWQRSAAARRHGITAVCVGLTLAGIAAAVPAAAQSCSSLVGLYQRGRSDKEVARMAGISPADAAFCRRELSQPIYVGPAGAVPFGAAGPAPRNAAGPPPRDAAGPPPRNAAGPPPLNAAGPPPSNAAGAPSFGAAGPPPVGRDVKRIP